MKIFFLVLLVIVFGAVGYLGYLGFVPGLNSVFGSDKPRDLGIVYTSENYKTADEKANVEIVTIDSVSTVKESLVWEGKKDLIDSFSAEELTATINTHEPNWKYFPVSNAQVKVNNDGSAEFAGILHFDRLAGYAEATGANYTNIKTVMDKFKLVPSALPIYLNARATVQNGQVSFGVNKAEFGRASIPNSLITENQGAVNNFFTQQVNAIPGFYIESLDFNNGKMNFKGSLPEKVTTAKN